MRFQLERMFREERYLDTVLFTVICILFFGDGWQLLDALDATTHRRIPGITLDRSILIAGFVALLLWKFLTRRTTDIGSGAVVALGAICGAMFFARSLGTTLLDPQNIEWLLRGDWAEHYASWESYRAARWTWPPGAIPDLFYPAGTAIVFTDSLPLFAMPAKLFRDFLPYPFQYIGLAFAVNFVLQGALSAVLMKRMKARPAALLAGCLLFLFAPVLIWRIGHDSLTAQWLILASLFLYFRSPAPSLVNEIWPWCVVACVAAFTHPYFPPMVMAIALAYWTRRTIVERERTPRAAITALCVIAAVVLFAWWLSGAFTLHFHDGGGGVPYGIYSFNLLGFFNSAGFSRLVPPIPGVPSEQWEGAAYLGVGILGLAALLSVDALTRIRTLRWPRRHWPLSIITVVTVLFAASTRIMIGPWHLTDQEIVSPFLSTYRASGRFIWIAFYLILLLTLWQIVRRFPRAASALFACALGLQMFEDRAVHLHFASLRSGLGWPPSQALLSDPEWDSLVQHHRNLTMLPPIACGEMAGTYLPFQLLAAKHAMTFNSGYLARWDSQKTTLYCDKLNDDITNAHYSADDVYIVGPIIADKVRATPGMTCRTLDGFPVCMLGASTID